MTTKTIEKIIDDVLAAEGGYSNHPHDGGGETMYGITAAVARAAGYKGAMKSLPKETARQIYYQQYVVAPKFDQLLRYSHAIAAEVVDTGVNMGVLVAGKFLQRALNALNDDGKLFADLLEDGDVGAKTRSALEKYLAHRRASDGERVLLLALNVLQGARYIELSQANKKNEAFVFGWLRARVAL